MACVQCFPNTHPRGQTHTLMYSQLNMEKWIRKNIPPQSAWPVEQMCFLYLQEKQSITLRSKRPENNQPHEFTCNELTVYMSRLYRQMGMNQTVLTTLVRAQAWKSEICEINVASGKTMTYTKCPASHCGGNVSCHRLPSVMNLSKCFSRISLPLSKIWMASNVIDP